MGVQAMTFCFSPYLGFQMGRSWVLPPHLQKDTTEEVRKPVFQTLMLSARENQLSLEERALLQERMEADLSGFNIDAPRWDQCTFLGRVKHFFNVTDPRTVLVPERELDWAKVMVEKSRMGTVPPGTRVEQLLYAKKLYDSAFHPDTGDKMNVIGRMSFQVPGGMIITGFMLQFYRTIPAVVFWQWVNQSFNALVNYTNRNAASPTSVRQMAVSYVTATTAAVATAVGMNTLTKRAPPLVGRWVPFAAVAAANCVNIPMMRQQELIQGICVKDRNHNEIGHSRRAAAIGITQVVISRITMAAPGMILLPVIMERLEKLHCMKRIQVLHAPLQVLLSGCFLIFMVPVACGLFPQKWYQLFIPHLVLLSTLSLVSLTCLVSRRREGGAGREASVQGQAPVSLNAGPLDPR
ncbi:sideroflexin-2 isoform X1 [Delphinapterus leucas]|uniref:Sideroflexin-2 isoform X1 n=4 Tax=Delphinapterus leucas TaxID=9749 RepID=A0A2Y9MUJ6_DELLE|nr:sideroflexin-2 isoform X1 [Delphinapterus leucas]